MSKRDKYAPDYRKLYPGVEIAPDVLRVLTGSDRKMKYCEFDLKTERKRKDKRTEAVTVLPAKEDSLERLEESQHYLSVETSLEQELIERDELERLRSSLKRLEPKERELVQALFFEQKTERQYAKSLGISQMAVNKRWHKVRLKIKKLMD